MPKDFWIALANILNAYSNLYPDLIDLEGKKEGKNLNDIIQSTPIPEDWYVIPYLVLNSH